MSQCRFAKGNTEQGTARDSETERERVKCHISKQINKFTYVNSKMSHL